MEISLILSALKRKKMAASLIAGQIALSLAIIANALFIIDDRLTLAARPSGAADEQTIFRIDVVLNDDNAERIMAGKKRDAQLIAAVPDVESVSITNTTPLSRRNNSSVPVTLSAEQVQGGVPVSLYLSPNSLVDTLQLKLLQGRDFVASEQIEVDPKSTQSHLGQSAIVSNQLAMQLFPDGKALGKDIYAAGQKLTIVGIVETLQTPRAQTGSNGEYSMILPILTDRVLSSFVVRAQMGQRDRVMREVESLLLKQDSHRIIEANVAMDAHRAERYSTEIAMARLLITVTILLLLVTASGIVGLVSLWVNQRRRQIGIRRALGARKRDIVRYFFTEMLLIGSVGVVIGILLGLSLNKILINQFEIIPMPASYLMFGALIMLLLSCIAVLGPARRAASISPAVATRIA